MCASKIPQNASSGFTLVEMIIAITILVIVAILGWRGLDGIFRSRIALISEMEQPRGMQLTFAQLQSDCDQLAPGRVIPGRATLLAPQDRLLMVSPVFAEQQPSRVQVVGYQLRNGVLTRHKSLAVRGLNVLDQLWQNVLSDAVDDAENSQAGGIAI